MDFFQKLSNVLDKTELERKVREVKKEGKPIENLGDLIKDYIDKKGDKYNPRKLVDILNKDGDWGAPYFVQEDQSKEYKNMIKSIDRLISKPEYLEKMEKAVFVNEANGALTDWHIPAKSVLDNVKQQIEKKKEFQNSLKLSR